MAWNRAEEALPGRAAQEIAFDARAFGQEDDITVLTISLAPVPEVSFIAP